MFPSLIWSNYLWLSTIKRHQMSSHCAVSPNEPLEAHVFLH